MLPYDPSSSSNLSLQSRDRQLSANELSGTPDCQQRVLQSSQHEPCATADGSDKLFSPNAPVPDTSGDKNATMAGTPRPESGCALPPRPWWIPRPPATPELPESRPTVQDMASEGVLSSKSAAQLRSVPPLLVGQPAASTSSVKPTTQPNTPKMDAIVSRASSTPDLRAQTLSTVSSTAQPDPMSVKTSRVTYEAPFIPLPKVSSTQHQSFSPSPDIPSPTNSPPASSLGKRPNESDEAEPRKIQKGKARRDKVSKKLLPEDLQLGRIVFLKKTKEYFSGHPAVIFGPKDEDDHVPVMTVTSFNGRTITEKWGADVKDPEKAKAFRRRYLLIEHGDAATHDDLPVLGLQGKKLRSQSYLDLSCIRLVHVDDMERFSIREETDFALQPSTLPVIETQRNEFFARGSPYLHL